MYTLKNIYENSIKTLLKHIETVLLKHKEII